LKTGLLIGRIFDLNRAAAAPHPELGLHAVAFQKLKGGLRVSVQRGWKPPAQQLDLMAFECFEHLVPLLFVSGASAVERPGVVSFSKSTFICLAGAGCGAAMFFVSPMSVSRMWSDGSDGVKSGLSAGNQIRLTRTSRATATRELHDLVEKKALLRTSPVRL